MHNNQSSIKSFTSLDIIKTIAIIIMIIDHIGFYLWPENLWLRALGRWCVPIWFFLIGYGRHGRATEKPLICGALILMVLNPIVGLAMLPLNILPGMMLARAVLPRLMAWLGTRLNYYWLVLAVFIIAAPLTNLLWEYGTLGLLMAMLGWLVRAQREQKSPLSVPHIRQFYGLVIINMIVFEQISFDFNLAQTLFMSVGTMASLGYLYVYLHTARENAWLPKKLSPWALATYRWCGQHSLQIYVGHLVVFKLLATSLGQAGFMWFHWHWF